jgi:hypothetical protein
LFRVRYIQALPDNKRRLIAIGVVLLVHLLIVALILSGMPKMLGKRADLGEIFFVFAPKPKPFEKLLPAAPTPTRSVHVPIPREQTISPRTNIAPSPQINGLSLSLLRCAPENLANLSPEERAQCSSSTLVGPPASPNDKAPGIVREYAVDAGTWSASIARRNSPITAPCTSMQAIPEDVTTGRTAKVIMVDPLCALGLTKGSKQ